MFFGGYDLYVGTNVLPAVTGSASEWGWGYIATVVLGAIYATFTAATTPGIILTISSLVICIQVAILFDVYTPELFPTELRLRANGIRNTLGRAATIVSPFVVISGCQACLV
jgi:hypothetical protein